MLSMKVGASTASPLDGLGIIWAQYGPYHFARVEALRRAAGPDHVHALEFSNNSEDYLWERQKSSSGVFTLCPGIATEQLSFTTVFRSARRQFARLGVRVCLLPSYSPKQSLAALLAAKSLGIHTVMIRRCQKLQQRYFERHNGSRAT